MLHALWALSALATILAWIVARHRPEHRPIAWLLGYGLVTDAVREFIGAQVLRPARAELAHLGTLLEPLVLATELLVLLEVVVELLELPDASVEVVDVPPELDVLLLGC
jgi:hypothetical protein